MACLYPAMTNLLPESCNRKRIRIAVLIAAALPLLSACGSSNRDEDKLGTFLVAPGKYVLYDCQQLNMTNTGYIGRRNVLRKAMADAEKSPGGGVVSLLAYRTEYGQVEGNLAEIGREAASKKCTLNSATPAPAAPPPAPSKRRTR